MARFAGYHAYGIEFEELGRLGDRKVKVQLSLEEPPITGLTPLPPSDRLRFVDEHLERILGRIRAALPGVRLRPRNEGRCYHFDVVLPASSIAKFRRVGRVTVIVLRIQGLRKRRRPPRKTWYSVRARVAVQLEDQTRGLQDVEERTVLVQARS